VTDGYARNIGDRVERAGRPVKRDPKIACAWFDRIFFLNFILSFFLSRGRGGE
jgi:hypothetical protein